MKTTTESFATPCPMQTEDAVLHSLVLHNNDAAPLVLLHGNGESTAIFDSIAPQLSSCFSLYLLDTRGQGQSERGVAPLDISSTFVSDLSVAFECWGLNSANVLGFSDGANTALSFALQFPGKIQSLALLGANLDPSGLRIPTLVGLLFQEKFNALASPFSKKAKKRRELLQLMTKQPDIRAYSLCELDCPSIITVGEHDCIRPSHSEMIAAALPHSQFVVIKEADHFALQTHGELVVDALLQFYQDNNLLPH